MSTILPEGETIRKAVRWISEQLKENPNLKKIKLVNEAITRFDLSPKDADYLFNFYLQQNH